MRIEGKGPLRGEITVPGDKSISHRAIMFGAISQGDTHVHGFLESADCLSTIDCFRKMGISVEQTGAADVIVHGRGLFGLEEPSDALYTGNSGTTTRLISGILAGQAFETTLDGDSSIRRRPMKRIMDPLRLMGADIESKKGNDCAPLLIRPAGGLNGISYESPVASAQVKSCVLLAGLYAGEGQTTSVTEPALSRDHTERMLAGFGACVKSQGTTASILSRPVLTGQEITVPGDISSAAYFIAAALLVPGSSVLVRNVGINPTRAGILTAAQQMGADISVTRTYNAGGEPAADLLIRSSSLHGTVIKGDIIPSLIDELPVIAVMAAFAEGETVIRDAAELRVKESDRITVMCDNLRAMGADVEPAPDGMTIRGGKALHEAVIDSHLDHRIAMSFAVAALAAGCPLEIKDAECVNISYPGFYGDLFGLLGA